MNKCPDCLYEYNIEYEGRCPICGRDPYIFTSGELEGEGEEGSYCVLKGDGEMYDKEKIYDNEIAPLMKQIIEICKREELPMVAQFYLKKERDNHDEYPGEPMYCTTTIIPAKKDMDEEAHDWLKHVAESMRYGPNGKPFVMAATIRTS